MHFYGSPSCSNEYENYRETHSVCFPLNHAIIKYITSLSVANMFTVNTGIIVEENNYRARID